VSTPTAAGLDARYAAAGTTLRQRVLAFVTQAFHALGNYRDADAAVFVEQVLPTVLGAQAQMGALTDAYLAQTLTGMLGVEVAPVGVELPEQLRGVPPEEVYERPFRTIYTALGEGKSLTQAVTEGTARLTSVTSTDLQLARTTAAQQVGAATPGFHYFRRVLRCSHNCALCVIAATQRYSKAKLMPIHPGCDCGISPIPPGASTQQVIDPELLDAAHDAIGAAGETVDRAGNVLGRRANGSLIRDYQDLIITHEHGEIGPLLAVRRQNFTGPGSLPGP
jgi:hypothetical protein